jgi:hypothetical protein
MTNDSNTHFNLNSNNDIVPKYVRTVTVHPGVTDIRFGIFYECNRLSSINIPNSVTKIGRYAFYNCYTLSSIDIPNSVKQIGHYAFSCCKSLRSISIPNSVTCIGDNAFRYCTSLGSIKIPNSAVIIAHCAFNGCGSLRLIAIPQSAAHIQDSAFDNCWRLEQRQADGFNNDTDTQTWLRQRFVNLPLHQAFYELEITMTTALLTNLIQQHSSLLTSVDAMLMTPLHVFCCSPTVTAEMIQILKVGCPDAASMTNVLGETPLMIHLAHKDKEYKRFYINGQLLPLVDVLELGINWDILNIIWILGNEMMLTSELEERNETSGLLPFMLAGSLSQCGLDIVYELSMKRPDLLLNF